MKYRWASFMLCAVAGLVLLTAGLLVPAYLRALDAGVVQSAGQNSSTLVDDGQTLAGEKRLGAAQLVLQATRLENVPGSETFAANLADLTRQYPTASFWGDDAATEDLFGDHFKRADQNLTAASFFIRRENRDAALAYLRNSAEVSAKDLWQTRALNQTTIFSPSSSAAGQAFDAAVALVGLLLDGHHLTAGLRDEIARVAAQANQGDGSRPLEQALLDFTSMGERLNWDQLVVFAEKIPNLDTLDRLAVETRSAGDQLPVLFAAVQLSGEPAAVADYLAKFPGKGLPELGASLRYGAGGVSELARSQQRFYNSSLERTVTLHQPFAAIFYLAAKLTVQNPGLARAIKWLWYLLAGFFLAAAMHFAMPAQEYPRTVAGFHLIREILFALGFLLVVLILTEPFLSQDIQKGNFTLRLPLSGLGGAIPAGIAGLKTTPMNATIIITLLVFFVLQALIYISCLVKLAEIRRQPVPARIKLKLLENEDHLFDAGLYLGFVGTIAALIFASLHLIQFSLMAAYSSTSFGIIFVVIFKIFHLRPARRALLMEAEADTAYAETRVPVAAPTTVLPS
jgi:hypothetical protein